ncbi:hypothetical protein CV019_13075, partial [Staphylococcus haemolyticus]
IGRGGVEYGRPVFETNFGRGIRIETFHDRADRKRAHGENDYHDRASGDQQRRPWAPASARDPGDDKTGQQRGAGQKDAGSRSDHPMRYDHQADECETEPQSDLAGVVPTGERPPEDGGCEGKGDEQQGGEMVSVGHEADHVARICRRPEIEAACG